MNPEIYVQQIEIPPAAKAWAVEVEADGPVWLCHPGEIVAYANGLQPFHGVAGGLPGESPVTIDVPPGVWYLTALGPVQGRYPLTRPLRDRGEWAPIRVTLYRPR